jgi:hypothetical protein
VIPESRAFVMRPATSTKTIIDACQLHRLDVDGAQKGNAEHGGEWCEPPLCVDSRDHPYTGKTKNKKREDGNKHINQ